jgi:hypothetical protein
MADPDPSAERFRIFPRYFSYLCALDFDIANAKWF